MNLHFFSVVVHAPPRYNRPALHAGYVCSLWRQRRAGLLPIPPSASSIALWWKLSLQQLNLEPAVKRFGHLSEQQHLPPAISHLLPLHVPAGSAQTGHMMAVTHRKQALLQRLFTLLHWNVE